MKKKVALIFGGRSVERDISVITAVQTYRHLDDKKYAVTPVFLYEGDFYTGDMKTIKDFAPFVPSNHKKLVLVSGKFYYVKKDKMTVALKPDVVVNCCHGGEGENGVLSGVFEFNGLPHTSPSLLPSAICMDKAVSKELFENMLFNQVKHFVFSRKEWERDSDKVLFHAESFLRYPLIVKPARLGSSIGIGVAYKREDLISAIEVAGEFDDKIIVEEKLTDFIEVNCAAFKDGDKIVVSETEQPLSTSDFLSFNDKYSTGKMGGGGHIIPAEIGTLNSQVKALTERIYRELEMSGVVRVDYLVDVKREKIYLNEINTVPGSLAHYLFESAGITFKDLLDKMINTAIEDHLDRKSRTHNFSTGVLDNFKGGGKTQKM